MVAASSHTGAKILKHCQHQNTINIRTPSCLSIFLCGLRHCHTYFMRTITYVLAKSRRLHEKLFDNWSVQRIKVQQFRETIVWLPPEKYGGLDLINPSNYQLGNIEIALNYQKKEHLSSKNNKISTKFTNKKKRSSKKISNLIKAKNTKSRRTT